MRYQRPARWSLWRSTHPAVGPTGSAGRGLGRAKCCTAPRVLRTGAPWHATALALRASSGQHRRLQFWLRSRRLDRLLPSGRSTSARPRHLLFTRATGRWPSATKPAAHESSAVLDRSASCRAPLSALRRESCVRYQCSENTSVILRSAR